MNDINTKTSSPQPISLEQKAIPLRPKREGVRDQLQQAAEMYEKHFLTEMVKAMRSSVNKSDLLPESMGEKVYSQELDQEYVKSWVSRGGIGLSKVIFDQMAEKFGIPPESGSGFPLGRSKNDVFKLQQKIELNPKKLKFDLESKSPNASLEMPMDGIAQAWVQNPNGLGGNLLVKHGEEFQTVWSLPKKPNFEIQQSILAGEEILSSVNGEKIGLEIRSLHSS